MYLARCRSALSKGATPRTEDEEMNWDDAAEGIGEGIEGPEGFRDSDDDVRGD